MEAIEIKNILPIIRVAIFLWIALEATIIAFIYNYGYKNIKQSSIIRSLQMLFFTMSIYFLTGSFMPVIRVFDQQFYDIAINVLPITAVPLIYYMRRFRYFSLYEDSMELPDQKQITSTLPIVEPRGGEQK